MRRAVFCDVLHLLALAAPVDEPQHAEADQLERVAVRPAGPVIIPRAYSTVQLQQSGSGGPASLAGGVHAGMVDRVSLRADVPEIVDVRGGGAARLPGVGGGGGAEEGQQGRQVGQHGSHCSLPATAGAVFSIIY